MENLFAQIQELFPNGDCSITIHNIHIFALDDSWTKESNFIESDKRMYMTARKQANPFGITLFD